MFKFLKEKIKGWASRISKEKAEEPEEKKSPEKERSSEKKAKKKILVSAPEESEEEETKSFFRKIREKISKVKISEKEFEIYSEELKMLLLENNVAFPVAEKIISELGEKIINREFLKKEVEEQIKDSLKDIIDDILIEPFDLAEEIKKKNKKENAPYVMLFCGINGSGKTTTIAKIGDFLKKKNISENRQSSRLSSSFP